MDELQLRDALIAKLSNQIDVSNLQLIDNALSTVLKDFNVKKVDTELSTNVVMYPEIDLFISKLKYDNKSESTIYQYRKLLTDLLFFIGIEHSDVTIFHSEILI